MKERGPTEKGCRIQRPENRRKEREIRHEGNSQKERHKRNK
jgi:hypothetical protein